jgi:NAD(P)-dependent dehydrogenase (short-subunit alcohol dehydrogenase family)
MGEPEVAVVVGVGPGLGAALVQRLLAEGLRVAAVARDARRLESTLAQRRLGGARAMAADATDEAAIAQVFTQVGHELGPPSLAVFNAGTFEPAGILDLTPAQLERSWRVGCLGGFIVGQAAARAMLPRGRGTLLFSGATASLRGSARFAALAVPKFGLRALAQSMARELGPQGLHVAHVVIDGVIGESADDSRLAPAAIADAYWHLHRQPRSAWTHELDLRPYGERF